MSKEVIDSVVHQWSVDYADMAEFMDEPEWERKLRIKSKVVDPGSGTLMPTTPWHHAYWNEDAPEYDDNDLEELGEKYASADALDAHLDRENIETALLTGHEMRFLPGNLEPAYKASLASAYNQLLTRDWLEESDRMKGCILVSASDPEAAVAEIETYADDPEMLAVLIYGGTQLPFGHDVYRPIFETAIDADLPVMIHTSGHSITRQTSMAKPRHFATYETCLPQNHMLNYASMVFNGVFDDLPELEVIWAGEGVEWALHVGWRATRYYRNIEPEVPRRLEKEPHLYRNNCYFTTYPKSAMDIEHVAEYYGMLGAENILFGSGYPLWNDDTVSDFETLNDDMREPILRENAVDVFDLA
jgi:predicted TIM-barrel fold metal-dependent hydrolase